MTKIFPHQNKPIKHCLVVSAIRGSRNSKGFRKILHLLQFGSKLRSYTQIMCVTNPHPFIKMNRCSPDEKVSWAAEYGIKANVRNQPLNRISEIQFSQR